MKQHDELFREMVSDPGAQRDLVQLCLPELAPRMDLSTLTTADATFTGGKQADMLVSVREHSGQRDTGREHLVYILVEHKSYRDPLVAVQLYRYLGAIWQQQWIHLKSEERGPLPVIHPVVFYHGGADWKAPLELSALHERTRVAPDLPGDTPFITDLVYRLVDLNTLEPERLKISARTLSYVITLRHVLRPFGTGIAQMIFEAIAHPEIEQPLRERLLRYLMENTEDSNAEALLTEGQNARYTFGGGNIMTMAQELIRRGKVEGLQEGREEVARRMLSNGFDLNTIRLATGLTKEKIVALNDPTKESDRDKE